MANQQGNLSINSENIFPIIKKWLYSDHDIFFRELISNGCDAITKLKIAGGHQLPAKPLHILAVTFRLSTASTLGLHRDGGLAQDRKSVV